MAKCRPSQSGSCGMKGGLFNPFFQGGSSSEIIVAEVDVLGDDFVAANGTAISSRLSDTGDTWSVVKDAITINANRAVQTSVVAGGAIAVVDKGFADVVIKIDDYSTLAANDEISAVFRYVDNNNYYRAFTINTGNPVRIARVVGGVETLLVFGGSANDVGQVAAPLEIIVKGTEVLMLVNGMHLSTSIPLNPTATKHGFAVKKASTGFGGAIGNIKIYPYAAPIAENKWTVPEPPSELARVTLSTPSAFQVLQRTGSTADIGITGKFFADGGSHDIEASFNGGAYQTIATGRRQTFTGTLTAQSQGQGNLIVRWKDNTSISVTVPYVGIGDVYLSCGQSNGADWGQISALQSATHATLKAAKFGQSYLWTQSVDPCADYDGWVDLISKTGPGTIGSYSQSLMTQFMADQNVPIAIIPASSGGSAISQWQKGSDPYDRTTLFGSAMYRASLQPNGIKLILMHQGESDATIASGPTAPATYQALLSQFVTDAVTTLGSKLKSGKVVVSKIHKWDDTPSTTQANVDGIGASVDVVVSSNSSAVLGADFDKPTKVATTLHFSSPAAATDAATRLWTRLKAVFY